MSEAGPKPRHDTVAAIGGFQSIIQISGQAAMLDEPREMIRQAIRTLKTGKALRYNHCNIAKKVFALLYSASLRAKSIGQWHSSHPYNPLADFLELKVLARDRLGPQCPASEMVSQVRAAIDESVRAYSEQVA